MSDVTTCDTTQRKRRGASWDAHQHCVIIAPLSPDRISPLSAAALVLKYLFASIVFSTFLFV